MQMQKPTNQPSTRGLRMVMDYSVKPPGFYETLSFLTRRAFKTPEDRKKT
jgi:hypothetical protein